MNQTILTGAVAVPLIIGIIHVLKSSGLPSRFAPPAALFLGLCAGVAAAWQGSGGDPIDWSQAALLGITWGLAAVGLYESGSTARQTLAVDANPYVPPPSNWPNAGKTVETKGAAR